MKNIIYVFIPILIIVLFCILFYTNVNESFKDNINKSVNCQFTENPQTFITVPTAIPLTPIINPKILTDYSISSIPKNQLVDKNLDELKYDGIWKRNIKDIDSGYQRIFWTL